MRLCFPFLHSEFLTAAQHRAMPAELRFLDPGTGDARSPDHVPAAEAPFDRRTARALLSDMLRYGESVGDPRELTARTLTRQAGELSGEGEGRIRDAVERALLGPGRRAGDGDDPLLAARRRAQTLLLLDWSLEERLLELRGIDERLRDSWDRLDASVSEDDDEPVDAAERATIALGGEGAGLRPLAETPQAVPWRTLLEPFALLAPADVVLWTPLAEISETLAEFGVAEAPADAAPGAVRVFRDALWRFLGRGRAPEGRPWLLAELTVAVWRPAEG